MTMSKRTTHPISLLFALSLVCTGPTAFAGAKAKGPTSATAPLHLKQFTLCRSVEGRHAMDSGDTFDANGERIYAFIRVANASRPTRLWVVWRRGNTTYHRLPLHIGQSAKGWRTWAYLTARPSLKGSWSVSIEDAQGDVLGTRSFLISRSTR